MLKKFPSSSFDRGQESTRILERRWSFSFSSSPPPLLPSFPYSWDIAEGLEFWGSLVVRLKGKNHSDVIHKFREFCRHCFSREVITLYSLECSNIWTLLLEEVLIWPYFLFPDCMVTPYACQNIFLNIKVTQHSSSFGMKLENFWKYE